MVKNCKDARRTTNAVKIRRQTLARREEKKKNASKIPKITPRTKKTSFKRESTSSGIVSFLSTTLTRFHEFRQKDFVDTRQMFNPTLPVSNSNFISGRKFKSSAYFPIEFYTGDAMDISTESLKQLGLFESIE